MQSNNSPLGVKFFLVIAVALGFLLIGFAGIIGIDASSQAKTAASNTRALLEPTDIAYAIIGPASFEASMQSFIAWKTDKGLPAKYYTTEDISSSEPGPDLQFKIHSHLEDLNDIHNLSYVLLVGDDDVIPPRVLHPNAAVYGFQDTYISDAYYAGLDNDWDQDSDQDYGEYTGSSCEADLNFDVAVGRLPVSNVGELDIVIAKTLAYEKNPPAGNWANKMEIWGTLMDAPNNVARYEDFKDNAYKIGEKLNTVNNNDYQIVRKYDYDQLAGGSYNKNDDGLTKSIAKQDLNDGLAVINFAGQARYEAFELVHYESDTGMEGDDVITPWKSLFSYTDAASMMNGNKLPFCFFATCNAGQFNVANDQSLEKLLTAPNGGAIGLLSNTGKSYRGEEQLSGDEKHWGNWYLLEKFWKNFHEKNYTKAGNCWARTLMDYKYGIYDTTSVKAQCLTNIYGYVYLGDPSVDIYSDPPTDAAFSSDIIYTGARTYEMTVRSSGDPVPNAYICIRGEQLYKVARTNSTGVATVDLDLPTIGQLNITVTGHNIKFKKETIQINTAPADVIVLPTSISFSNTSVLKDRDDVTIGATVSNLGQLTADNVAVDLYLGDPEGGSAVLVGTENIGILSPAAEEIVSFEWTAIGGDHELFFVSSSTTEDLDPDNNNISVQFHVQFPKLSIFNGDITITPKGSVAAGDTVNISYLVSNNGECEALNVPVQIYDGNATEEGVLIKEQVIGSIPKGNGALMGFDWVVTPEDKYIRVKVNPLKEIYEEDHSDNTAFYVMSINDPPVVAGLSNLTIHEDDPYEDTKALVNLKEVISDEDDNFNELDIKISHNSPNNMSINGYDQISLKLNKDWYGIIDVELEITDPRNTVLEKFSIDVLEVNDDPVLNLTNTSFDVYEDREYELQLSAFDIEGDQIKFYDDTEIFDIDKDTGMINFTPLDKDLGKTHLVTITVKDSRGGETNKQISFNLIGINDKPEIEAIPDITLWVGDSLNYQVKATDPDSPFLEYSDDSPIFNINGETGLISYTPKPEDAGTYDVTITVSDGSLFETTSFKITVNYNETKEVEPEEEEESLLSNGNMIYLILGVIIFIVVLIIVIVAVKSRKPKKQLENYEERRQKEPPKQRNYEDLYGAEPVMEEEALDDGGDRKRKKKERGGPGPVEEPEDTEGEPLDLDDGEVVDFSIEQEEPEMGEMDFDPDTYDEAFGDEDPDEITDVDDDDLFDEDDVLFDDE